MGEKRVFDTERLAPSYFRLALPVVFSMVITLIYNLADTYFIAKTGDAMLVAGVSLCAPLMILSFIGNAEIVADGAVMLRWQISGMVFSAVVLLYTCLFQASGKALQALAMFLSRQGVLFVAVFVIAVAVGGYRGFLAAQPIADALSAALALALYRGAFGRRA